MWCIKLSVRVPYQAHFLKHAKVPHPVKWPPSYSFLMIRNGNPSPLLPLIFVLTNLFLKSRI